jgi:secreted trypsin-like serine protease
MAGLRSCAIVLGVIGALLAPASASAITGGQPATRDYPFMAALHYQGEFICGASLVAPNWALSAAHCVASEQASDFSVRIGTQDLNGSAGETIPVAQVIRHERYGQPRSDSHDVALFRLARPSSTGSPVALADPATEKPLWAPGRPALVVGFGCQDFPACLLFDGRLREADVPMASDSACAFAYLVTGDFEPQTMVCAGEPGSGRDACQGDSGGPLVADDGAGAFRQVGVVSWGLGCGSPTQYGVYARVGDQELYDWIRPRIAAAGSGAAPPPAPGVGTAAPPSPATGAGTGVPPQPTAGAGSAAPAQPAMGAGSAVPAQAAAGAGSVAPAQPAPGAGSAAPAQPAPGAGSAGPRHPATGAITGKVRAKSRAALGSARVNCGRAGSARTARDGRYRISRVPEGTYSCTAAKIGYVRRTATAKVKPGAVLTANFTLRPR